jgi:putative oxidoreductase
MFILHGFPKLAGGPTKWAQVGSAMANLGITFFPAFWGFMAACSEFIGAILLIMGIFFKPACSLLAVATAFHLAKGDGIMGASHALEMMIVFIALIFTGPGKFKFSAVG